MWEGWGDYFLLSLLAGRRTSCICVKSRGGESEYLLLVSQLTDLNEIK